MDETGNLIEAGSRKGNGGDPRLRSVATRDLVSEVARKASDLARKEVELAKAEFRRDLRSELKMASGLGAGAVCGILLLALLLVSLGLAIAQDRMPVWAGPLIVAGGVLVVGALASAWGWAKRVKKPLEITRRSLSESVRWAKGRFA